MKCRSLVLLFCFVLSSTTTLEARFMVGRALRSLLAPDNHDTRYAWTTARLLRGRIYIYTRWTLFTRWM